MVGTISRVVRFEDNEWEFELALTVFSHLPLKYGKNPLQKVIFWDSIVVKDEEETVSFRIGEFPLIKDFLSLDSKTLNIMEHYLEELGEELTVENINRVVRRLNEALGEERVYYEASLLGLKKGEAYLIFDILALNYLENVLEGKDREIFEEAVKVLLRYI